MSWGKSQVKVLVKDAKLRYGQACWDKYLSEDQKIDRIAFEAINALINCPAGTTFSQVDVIRLYVDMLIESGLRSREE